MSTSEPGAMEPPEQRHNPGTEPSEKVDPVEFAAAASHDLSAPLRLISGYSELLTSHLGDSDPVATDILRGIHGGVRRMEALVEGLLAFSRSAGDSEAALEPLDTAEICDAAIETLAQRIADSDATVERGELPVVLGLRGPLTQLFQNLIENAIKFRSEDPPEVKISCHEEPGVWHLQVTDNGCGIDQQDTAHVFDLFKRGRPQTKGGVAGSGIGLAIVKRVVDRHRGRVWIEPREGGTTFHVTLPQQFQRRDDPPTAQP